MPDTDDRVALVTGAGSGIGLATARLLAAGGQTVVLVGRRAELLDEAAAAITAGGGAALALTADLAERDAPSRIVAEVMERTGRLDVLVNNAASYKLRDVAELTLDD